MLVARDGAQLETTAELVRQAAALETTGAQLSIDCFAVDLGELSTLASATAPVWHQLRDATKESPRPRCVLFNNAGSVGPLGCVADDLGWGADSGEAAGLANLCAIQASIDLNVTSALWITSVFTSICGAPRSDLSTPTDVSTTTAADLPAATEAVAGARDEAAAEEPSLPPAAAPDVGPSAADEMEKAVTSTKEPISGTYPGNWIL